MDIISECEKLGDYVVNVVEARTDIKEKKIWFVEGQVRDIH